MNRDLFEAYYSLKCPWFLKRFVFQHGGWFSMAGAGGELVGADLLTFDHQVLGVKLPNMLGRAEKMTFQFSYGTKETSYGLSFFKPQPGCFERK